METVELEGHTLLMTQRNNGDHASLVYAVVFVSEKNNSPCIVT